jgi:hypothetical protein
MSEAARTEEPEIARNLGIATSPAPVQAPAKKRKRQRSKVQQREAWSRRMVPLMTKMLVGLTIFFFLASAAQLSYLHYQITEGPESDLGGPLAMMGMTLDPETREAGDTGLPAAAVAALTVLELGAMERRYHQANVSLLSRVWTRYLGFVTGMVLAMVGAAFILGRLENESPSTVKATGPGGPVEVKSTSPGIVMAGLGVALMITTIVIHHEIQVNDQAVYATGWSFGPQGQTGTTTDGSSKKQELSVKEPEKTTGSPNSDATGIAANPNLQNLFPAGHEDAVQADGGRSKSETKSSK